MTASIDGEELSGDDWIGSFRNGYCSNPVATTEDICDILEAEWNPEEICVGARKWGDCGGNGCDVPAMGDDGTEYTMGYMTAGVIPTFKIYDASNDEYLDAIVSDDYPWANQGMFVVNSLGNAIVGCLEMDACNYDENANLEGDCSYPEENFDCEGNCIAGEDCAGVCGGGSDLDDCGVCDGGNADMDDCGVCNGGNADDLGCGCFEPAPSGCDNVCGSTLENDECGECGGDGIDVGACDCDGNIEDDCGDCDGGNAAMDDCGVCNGGNADDLGCGCGEPGPSGCDNTCGST